MMKKDLPKQTLYESVKTLLETESDHIHLPQQKLFTLFSIAFQYLLFTATKRPGSYIIRVEDNALADKLSRKAKDPSTRSFMTSLMVPRKLKYGQSTFYLDFFNMSSWNLTRELPKEKIMGALVVKNTGPKPMKEIIVEGEVSLADTDLPMDYFYAELKSVARKSLIIAYGQDFEGTFELHFPFIKKEKERALSGVTISKDIDLEEMDD